MLLQPLGLVYSPEIGQARLRSIAFPASMRAFPMPCFACRLCSREAAHRALDAGPIGQYPPIWTAARHAQAIGRSDGDKQPLNIMHDARASLPGRLRADERTLLWTRI
jgi:hypothetical protein